MNIKRCRHCKKKLVCRRPRGLCWRCYTTPEIKILFFPEVDYNIANPQQLPLPARPTKAEPGSASKVQTLIKRAESGLALWHPDDLSYKRRPVRSTLPT